MSHTTINGLGAFGLAVSDRVQEAIETAAGHGSSGPPALLALDGFAGGGSIESLRRVLGITHSGVVRLIDRLAAAGLVERRTGANARQVSIHLTPEGRRTARRVRNAREAAIAQLLAPLSAAQQNTLESLLRAMFGVIVQTEADARLVCRLCDGEACGHRRGRCPATTAAPS